MANNTTGLTRIIKAAGYSWKGFRAAWINEAAFRQEGVAAIIAVIIACFLDVRCYYPRTSYRFRASGDDSGNS